MTQEFNQDKTAYRGAGGGDAGIGRGVRYGFLTGLATFLGCTTYDTVKFIKETPEFNVDGQARYKGVDVHLRKGIPKMLEALGTDMRYEAKGGAKHFKTWAQSQHATPMKAALVTAVLAGSVGVFTGVRDGINGLKDYKVLAKTNGDLYDENSMLAEEIVAIEGELSRAQNSNAGWQEREGERRDAPLTEMSV